MNVCLSIFISNCSNTYVDLSTYKEKTESENLRLEFNFY